MELLCCDFNLTSTVSRSIPLPYCILGTLISRCLPEKSHRRSQAWKEITQSGDWSVLWHVAWEVTDVTLFFSFSYFLLKRDMLEHCTPAVQAAQLHWWAFTRICFVNMICKQNLRRLCHYLHRKSGKGMPIQKSISKNMDGILKVTEHSLKR
jgi:hypothetical protein